MNKSIVYILLILLFNQSCNILGDTKNELIREESDYKGNNKAVLFIKYAGATSDNSINLSIISNHDKIKDKQTGNIFIADSDHGSTTIDSSCTTFKWVSSDTLIVTYDSRLRIFNQQTRFEYFVIKYKTK